VILFVGSGLRVKSAFGFYEIFTRGNGIVQSAKRKVIGNRRLKRVGHRDEATARRCFLFFECRKRLFRLQSTTPGR